MQAVDESNGVQAIKATLSSPPNGGYPLDQKPLSVSKAVLSLACAKKDVSHLAASCRGSGRENFGNLMQSEPPGSLQRILATPPEKTISEQWCVQFRQSLAAFHHHLVSLPQEPLKPWDSYIVQILNSALESVWLKGCMQRDSISDGVSVIVKE